MDIHAETAVTVLSALHASQMRPQDLGLLYGCSTGSTIFP